MRRLGSVSRSDRKKAALLDAAAQLFAARPDVESVSVDEVAALAGISKATVYRYFPSKAALVEAVAAREGVDPAAWHVPDRRAQIVEAAARIIPQRGLRATTMEQIAEEAGISPATIYWHFTSKDDLVIAVADHCSPVDVFRHHLARGTEGDPEEDLLSLVRAMLQHSVGRFEVIMTCLAEGWASPRVAAHFVRTIAAPAWAVIGAYFEAQVKAGRFKPAPFVPRLLSLAGPMWAYLLARRSMGGLIAHAAATQGAESPLGASDHSGAAAGLPGVPGLNPLSLLLSLAGGAHGMGQEGDAALTPEQMARTHVETFLAGNATPAYLRELERRRAAR